MMSQPLAERLRPKTLDDYIGQKHLVGQGAVLRKMIDAGRVPSFILWGPPGVGKTTLAQIIANKLDAPFYTLSAISSGVKDVREVIEKAKSNRFFNTVSPILFIDEIHRFSKSQQDSLLNAVETGVVTLIGATTENPSFEVIRPLLSRCQVYILNAFSKEDLEKLFHFLDYKIEDIFARVFLKIFAKVIFFNYKKEHNIQDCYLIQDYVKDYEDYKEFISLVLDYYNNFTYTEANEEEVPIDYKIDINYFFSGLKNENFERYINELIENNNKEEILVLINVIPIKAKYKELLVNTLNFLDTNISNEEIITLLTKNTIPTSVYVELLNDKTSNINKGFTYNYVMEEINDQEELFVHISENILDIDCLSKIDDIVAEIQETKNTVLEINLENTIT